MTALLLIDLQYDFMPGGALPTKEGLHILPAVNALLQLSFDLIVASQDWHPKNHASFATTQKKQPGDIIQLGGVEQILWPDHCVQNSRGAEFIPGWDFSKVNAIVQKGIQIDLDSYSAFYDNAHKRSTRLHLILQKHHIHTLVIAGVATDYCVNYTVKDALSLKYSVYVATDGCAAVNVQPDNESKALVEMEQLGAHLITSDSPVIPALFKGAHG